LRRAESDEVDAVLRQHGNSVWRLIVRILGTDGHDAADCFQQAFVELVERHRRSNDVDEVVALLKRIATNRAIDVVRRRIRERGRSQEFGQSQVMSRAEFDPAVQAEAAEFLGELRDALAELPDQQSAAFVLTQMENLPNNQAAVAIGVSVNHVGVLIHRARAALRVRLDSYKPVRAPRP